MPTNTYVALRTETVAAATGSVTFDLTGISGYTDLELVANVQATSSGQGLSMQFNNDNGVGSLYSNTGLRGNGSTVVSFRQSNNTSVLLSNLAEPPTSVSFGLYNAKFFNYANTNIFKTILVRSNSASFGVETFVDLWRNTNAITSIKITISDGNIAVGSTFSLYGIKSEAAAAKATGGLVASDSTYFYHLFTSSGTFTPAQSLTADLLLVGGGGASGGGPAAGGGGAGGVIAFASQALTTTPVTVTIGAGGVANANGNLAGTAGSNTTFGALTAAYGGSNPAVTTGGPYGSIGGGSANGGGTNEPSVSPTQGNNGGTASFSGSGDTRRYSGGGGGGFGSGGGNAIVGTGGTGGAGVNTVTNWGALANAIASISIGVSGYIAGGGGGGYGRESSGGAGSFGVGGSGGGGRGGNSNSNGGVSGTVNTGSGGGGNGFDSGGYAMGGNGGSGLIVIRYLKA